MGWLIRPLERRSPAFSMTVSVVLVAIIGILDYLSGYEIFLSAFYLLPVAVAAWFLGSAAGILISVLSGCVWMAGDVAAGATYHSLLVPIWNGVIALIIYIVVVQTLVNLRTLNKDLEERVRQRTRDLSTEMQERERLEKEILEIGERERQRIGHDLHDSLCQQWTAIAMAGQVLGSKLASRSLPEADDAQSIVRLATDGLTLTRSLAHSISPVQMDADGLRTALHELSQNIARIFQVDCTCVSDDPIRLDDSVVAMHLYRIAQEAINNALRHGKAKQIVIGFSQHRERTELTIEDNGGGLAETWQANRGMGIRIMAHRASMIGGAFTIGPNPTGGTFVSCTITAPLPAATTNSGRVGSG